MASGADLSMLIRGRDESAAAFSAARKSLEGFGAAASSVARTTNASLGTMSAAARSTAGGFTAVASVSRSAVTGFGAVSLAARSASGHMTALAGATRTAAAAMQAEIAKLGRAATAATATASAALTAGLGASVKGAADFEKTISGVAAVSGASAAQIKELSTLALKLGADTSFSATEAAQGIEELVKAGVSMGDVMGGAAKASLDLAAAGGVSVAESATIASNAMNAFGIKGSEMGRVADLIAGAANASAIDVHEFGFALQASGAVAATVGMSFDDLSVAIAEMGQAGIKGSDAGTSLKTFLMGLQPQTKEQTKLFRELGLMTKDGANQFFDARGKLKSLADVQAILQNSMKGMTDQQRLATMETLFGSDAVRAAAVLAKGGAAGFAEMAAAMGKVSAADVAEKRLDNLSGSVEKFKGSLSTAAITIGTGFLPSLKRIVDGATATLNAWMPAITAFSERIPGAMDALISKALQLGPTVQRIFTDMGQVVGAFVGLELDDYMAGWDTWIGTMVRVKDIATGALSGLIDAVSLLINLDPGAYANAWETLRGVFAQVVSTARTAISGVVGAVQAGLPAIRSAFDTLLPVVLAVGQGFIDNIAATIQFVVQRVLPPLMSIIQQTAGFFLGTLQPALASTSAVIRGILGDTLDWLASTVWPPLLTIAQATVSFWTGRLLPAISAIAGPLRTVLGESIQWVADVGWPALLSAAGVVVDFFATKIAPMLPSLAQSLRSVLGAAITWVASVGWPLLVTAASVAAEFITGTVVPAISRLVEWLGPKVSAVVNWMVQTGWPALVTAAQAVSDWVTGIGVPAFSKVVEWLGPKVSEVVKWLTETGWPKLKEAGQAVSDWIEQKAVPAVKDAVEWLGPKLSDVVKWLTETGWPEMQRVGETVRKMFEDTLTWVKDLWTKLGEKGVWTDLTEAVGKLWDAGKILVETFWPDMKDGADQAFKPTDVFVALIKGASGFLVAFATGVESIAKALQFLKEQAAQLPDWLVNGLKNGAIPSLGPAGGVLAPLLPGGAGQTVNQSMPSGYTGEWERKAFEAGVKAGHPNPTQFVEQMRWESGGFAPDVISGARTSGAGAMGIAQIMPDVARSAGVDALDPEQALAYAARRMADNYRRFNGDAERALAEYNMGAGNLDRYGPRGLPETNSYIDIIGERTRAAEAASRAAGQQAAGNVKLSNPISGQRSINQFSLVDQGLSWSDAEAACGPAALLSFWAMTGRTPDASEAMQMARASGWTQAGGMNGVGNFMKMLGMAGVDAALDATPTREEINSSLDGGNAVALSNANHYFMATGYDKSTGKYNVGGSGEALKGGSAWMTLDEIEALSGPLTSTVTMFTNLATAAENTTTAVAPMNQSLGDNQRALLFVIDTLAQQRFLLDATGQANTALAVDMMPVINLLEQQGTISAASALMLREQAQGIIDSGAAGISAQGGIDTFTGSAAGMATAADMAAMKANEMAQKAAAIGRASESASDQVSDLADSLGELPSWFTPSGKAVDAIFKPDKRAMGGPVSAGVPYLVGERGPELFVPGRPGGIVPSGGFGGGTTVINLTVQGSLIHERDLQTVVGQAVDDSLRYGGRLGRYG